ncbi:IBR domain containing protein [Histomonas meleagridis]|uniref:IBR domain containing protein n=1 Tax=Histomonas meleagridis TaxID=135588 RepID=UPI0035593829|nr:IBR domain containing protein [Histomonas meleagridis]KAH0801848.1 IBR domain containing protein [Histomonas meleagridis]
MGCPIFSKLYSPIRTFIKGMEEIYISSGSDSEDEINNYVNKQNKRIHNHARNGFNAVVGLIPPFNFRFNQELPPMPQRVRGRRIFRMPRAPAMHPPNKPKKTKEVYVNKIIRGIKCSILKVNYNVLSKLKEAQQVRPDLNLARASTFFKMVNEMNGPPPDNIIDRVILASVELSTPSSNFNNECLLFIQNLYPSISIQNLKSELSKCHHNISETITSINNNPKIPKIRKPRQANTNLKFTDIIVSAQLEAIWSADEKEQEIERKKEEEERLMLEAAADGSLYECECCFCECPMERLVQCPEGHLFCFECVRKQIETSISEGRTDVPCLHCGGCDQMVPMSELERSMPESVLARLSQAETMNAIISANISGVVKCYKCGYMAIVDDDEEKMICPECKSETCTKCQCQYHQGMTCEQFRDIDKDRQLEEKMNEAVVRICPKCKTQFVKDEGCNKMECPRCHTWICYWCRKVIPKSVGYNHFWRGEVGVCPPDKCPLWVQNNTLHEIEAEQVKALNQDVPPPPPPPKR